MGLVSKSSAPLKGLAIKNEVYLLTRCGIGTDDINSLTPSVIG